MIEITRTPDTITVCGHANFARHGKDIVCASISALAQTLIASLEDLTEDTFSYDLEAGNVEIVFEKNLSERAQLLVDSFFIGAGSIAAVYPRNVKVTKH